MDANDIVPLLLGHVEDHAVAQDAGHVDEDVQPAELVEGLLDHALAAIDVGDSVEVRDGLAAGGADLVGDVLRRTGVRLRAVDVHAEVVDDDAGAFLGKELGDAAPDAAARSGDYRDASI